MIELDIFVKSVYDVVKMIKKKANRRERNQGMNWIRPEKRLALYLRDGLACCYCGDTVERGVRLTLDHLRPYASNGSNNPNNLVTCCLKCNSSRGKRSWKLFAGKVAAYLNCGVSAAKIIEHIETTRCRSLNVAAAKVLIANRGGFTAALHGERS